LELLLAERQTGWLGWLFNDVADSSGTDELEGIWKDAIMI
jgi:hypothetical protein